MMNIEAAEAFELLRQELRAVTSPWLTYEEAALYTKLARTTIETLVKKGKLKVHYCTTMPRFHRKDLDGLMRKRKQTIDEMEVVTP